MIKSTYSFLDEYWEEILKRAANRYRSCFAPKTYKALYAAGGGDVRYAAAALDEFLNERTSALFSDLLKASGKRILLGEDPTCKVRYYYSESGFEEESDGLQSWSISNEEAVRAMIAFGHLEPAGPGDRMFQMRSDPARYIYELVMAHAKAAPSLRDESGAMRAA